MRCRFLDRRDALPGWWLAGPHPFRPECPPQSLGVPLLMSAGPLLGSCLQDSFSLARRAPSAASAGP